MVKKISILFVLLFFTSGCYQTTGNPGVTFGLKASKYSIHQLQGNERGEVLLLPVNENYEGDLVFKTFKGFFSEGLLRNGFTVAEDSSTATYVGFINYGIVTPEIKTTKVERSINGKSILFETGMYPITSTQGKPKKDWLGYDTGIIIFDRVVEFYLYDMQSGKADQILYSKITSTGECNQIAALADTLSTFMFKDYPPKNRMMEEYQDMKVRTEC